MGDSPETRLVKRMMRAVTKEWPHAWVVKIAGGFYQVSGIPDLLIVVNGRLVALEVKAQRPGESEAHARGRVTPGQAAKLEALARAGAEVGVVLTVEEVLEHVARVAPGRPNVVR